MSAPGPHPAATDLDRALRTLGPPGRLARFRQAVTGRIVLTTSFGLEDQVLTHWIAEAGLDVDLVTLDTGRLFPETYDVWAATEARYGVKVRPFSPAPDAVATLVARDGINGFRDSIAAREACCGIRKVRPLAEALAGAAGWITGLRGNQSAARAGVPVVSFDADRALLKLSPLADWTREQVAAFAARHDVPVNALHAQGFLSIGCAPCTRAIRPGEPERAGRWWWEDEAKKECGLHVTDDGRLSRATAQEARP